MLQSIEFRVDEPTQVGEARRAVAQLAEDGFFDAVAVARVAVVVAEIASNLVKHGGGGHLMARLFERHATRVIEVLGIDQGAGLRDIGASSVDGYSTSGTPGTGLGAIRRSASFFDLYSRPTLGTVVLAEIEGGGGGTGALSSPLGRELVAGGVCLPKPGETVSGDGWDVLATDRGVRVLVADGLGHGPVAGVASAQAIDSFQATAGRSIPEQLDAMNTALRPTRGAAVGIADIDRERGTMSFAGVGNIAAVVFRAEGSQRLMSHNGIVGHEMRKVQTVQCPWSDSDVLLMQSDGLSTQWNLSTYPGVSLAHPSIIAALAWRDLSRGRDDSTAVAVNTKPRRES